MRLRLCVHVPPYTLIWCRWQADRLAAAQQTLEGNMSHLYETAKRQIEERGRALSAARLELTAERAAHPT